MRYSTLFFDLDDTLYDAACGLWPAICERMTGYLCERLGMTPEQAAVLRHEYWQKYGTTLRGLQRHHQVDVDEYLAYVHDLPLERFLQPNPRLRELLLSLPQARWILTNADEPHARRVLKALGLEDCFHGVIDIRRLEFACKPEPEAYERALAIASAGAAGARTVGEAPSADPSTSIFFDDSPANLAPAQKLGITTVLVGPHPAHPAADFCLPTLLDLPARLPGLWDFD